MRHHRLRATASLVLGCLLLAACENPPEEASFGCPRVGLLDNHSHAMLPAGEAVDQAVAAVELADYDGHCRYDGEGVVVRMTLSFTLEGRASSESRTHNFAYYVAVQDKAGDLVAKRRFTREVSVPAPGANATVTEDLAPEFDLGDTPPASYTLLVGLVDGTSSRSARRAD